MKGLNTNFEIYIFKPFFLIFSEFVEWQQFFSWCYFANTFLDLFPQCKSPTLSLAKAKVVTDFVDQSASDLANNFFPAFTDSFDWLLEKSNFIWKDKSVTRPPPIKRYPLIQTQQVVRIKPHFLVQSNVKTILNYHIHVIHPLSHLWRKVVNSQGYQF